MITQEYLETYKKLLDLAVQKNRHLYKGNKPYQLLSEANKPNEKKSGRYNLLN
jgi:hypothetical protein